MLWRTGRLVAHERSPPSFGESRGTSADEPTAKRTGGHAADSTGEVRPSICRYDVTPERIRTYGVAFRGKEVLVG